MGRGAIIATVLLACMCAACGGIAGFVAVDGRPNTVLSASGTVSIVQLTAIDGQTQITVVTFTHNGVASSLNFCGNLVSRFPPGSFLNVSFSPGTPCVTVITISAG